MSNKVFKYKKIVLCILLIPLITIVFSILKSTFAGEQSYRTIKEAIVGSTGNVNPEYTEWLKLTEEERKNTIEPPMYVIKDNSYVLNSSKVRAFDETKSELIPAFYDSRNVSGNNYVTSVKDQQDTNWCGIFTANSNLESLFKKKYDLTYNFSERYHRYATVRDFLNNEKNIYGFNETPNSGTTYRAISGFFTTKRGPILETDMPFVNSSKLINISEIQNKNVAAYVKNIKFYPLTLEKNDAMILEMKKHIMDYGSLGVAIKTDEPGIYQSSNAALYYSGDNIVINHAVTIVGWDDNYSKDNFLSDNKPPHDGAWIFKNSWSTDWGKDGYAYISYDDKLVYKYVYGITDATNIKNFDNSYFHDPLGWSNSWGFGDTNPVYAGNKYEKKTANKEVLTEVAIGTLGVTNYELYINNVNSELISDNMKLIKSGIFEYAGYHTIELDKPILLEGTDFSLIVKYQVPGVTRPVPVQASYNSEGWESYQYDGYAPNQSFYSKDKDSYWYDFYNGSVKATASIKAFTKTIDYNFDIGAVLMSNDTIYGKVGEKITIPITSNNISSTNPYDIKIVKIEDDSNIDVTNKFSITGNSIADNSSALKLTLTNQIEDGDYKVEITHGYITKSIPFKVEEYINVTEITLSTYSATINKGEVLNITASIAPSTATNKTLSWISSNSDIVSVNSSGKITAIAEGNATITVSNSDSVSLTKTISLTITDYEYTTNYIIDGDYLENISKKTSYQDFINNFTLGSGITLKVKKNDDTIITSGYIGSNKKIELYSNNTLVKTYYTILKGDIDGDGDITAGDAYDIIFHSLGKKLINSRILKAADIDRNNDINAADAYDIILYTIGKKKSL